VLTAVAIATAIAANAAFRRFDVQQAAREQPRACR